MQYYLLLDSLLVPLALLLLLVLESLLLEVVLLVLTDQLVALLVFLNRKIVQISSLESFFDWSIYVKNVIALKLKELEKSLKSKCSTGTYKKKSYYMSVKHKKYELYAFMPQARVLFISSVGTF